MRFTFETARLYEAQKHDVELRLARAYSDARPGRSELNALRQCASNRSGHAILVLSAFLLPELDLNYIALIYTAGALIMFIDDHGDCFSDLAHDRVTFMNQVKYPERTLRRIFVSARQRAGSPDRIPHALLPDTARQASAAETENRVWLGSL
ncbi:hypothetical protein OKW43_008071 [Paraburkholderia sp. WC7.3g]|uniref:hypothetical protein n=1 Tax=Paraburkholderia sp. WC7.3g TaxID=2991070 RepID=UPI003D2193A0